MYLNEKEILDKALAALRQNVSFTVKSITHESVYAEYDADVMLDGHEFAVEARGVVTKANLGAVINQIKIAAKQKSPLLVSHYINSNIADVLRREDINYLDTVGNAYIKTKESFVLIKGNKAPSNSNIKIGQSFTPTGLKVVYAFLVKPELLNAPYRDIATAANVALGAVGGVINDLKEQQYIIEGFKNKHRQWNAEARDQLIDKWVEAYPKLRQKYLINRYTTSNHGWWENAPIDQYKALFAGEIAANKYTQYLKPQDHLVYIDKEKLNEFLKDFRLGISKERSAYITIVDVVETFWGNTLVSNTNNLTTPLLTYADLIASGDVRNREVAQMIRDEHL